jgi:hypothetical protein
MPPADKHDPAGAGSVNEPPAMTGTYDDAVRLRRWSFRQRTPQQRLD